MAEIRVNERVSFYGSVTKVSTFTSKGGGFKVELQVPVNESEAIMNVISNIEKVARFDVGFSGTSPAELDNGQAEIFDDEEA